MKTAREQCNTGLIREGIRQQYNIDQSEEKG